MHNYSLEEKVLTSFYDNDTRAKVSEFDLVVDVNLE